MALAEHGRPDSANGLSKFSATDPKPPDFVQRASIPNRNLSHIERSATAAAFSRRAFAEVRLPCMLYAAVGALTGEAGGDTELAVAQMRRLHGVLQVIAYEMPCSERNQASCAGVAVVTRGYWFSRQSLARLMAQCGGTVGMFPWHAELEAPEADARVTRGTAQFVDGHLHLWLPTVDADRSRARAAHIAAIAQDLVDLRVIGQPRSEAGRNVLVSAIALARALQPAPVQVIVAQDFEHHPEASSLRAAVPALPTPGALRVVGAKDLAA